MRGKRFPPLMAVVMIIAVTGCDNVAFGGVQFELEPPERIVTSTPAAPQAEPEANERSPDPIALQPLLYLVERSAGSGASLLPVAQIGTNGYEPIPEPETVPDLIERFGVNRWEAGTEIFLYSQGVRVGTFVSDGGTSEDSSTCQVRPEASGYVEVMPEAIGLTHFVGVAEPPASARRVQPSVSRFGEDDELRGAALNLAQRLIPALGVLWPPSIPEVRRDLQPLRIGSSGPSGLAVSYVYGDRLITGTPNSRAYSLFIVAAEGENRYEPLMTWYQQATRGKAYPRLVGAHDSRATGSPDLLLEVFGEEDRWLTIVGVEGDDWTELYRDACGVPPARGAIRTYR